MSRHGFVRASVTTVAALTAVGAGCVAWGAGYEVRSYRLRRFEVPVLPPGASTLRILHLSDLHLMPWQRRKAEWVRSLDALQPDLVIDTGDNLASVASVPIARYALEPLLARPGAFVLGSNDYYAPRPKNPAAYLWRPSRAHRDPIPLPTGDLVAALVDGGWADLTNARAEVVAGGRRVSLVGVDDPHLHRDRYLDLRSLPTPRPSSDARPDDGMLRLGVTHAPYRRVLDAMTADGLDLLIAGHTHGGQLCLPGYGALVTNCDLPRSHAKGLHLWTSGRTTSWLHVSAGLGTSPYAPVRFSCFPEASLLTLVPRG